jgi:predicted ester cyclase
MMFHTAFPDLDVIVDDMIAEGDKVAAHWTARGTHQGPFLGVPVTGKRVAQTGIDTYRYVDGKIVEWWRNDDTLGLMQQFGGLQVPTGSLPLLRE